MKFLVIASLLIFQFSLLAQTHSPVQEDYDEIFRVKKEKYEDREYLSTQVNQLPKDHHLSGLVNNNKRYLKYWLTNFVDHESFHQLKTIEGDDELQERFMDFLKNDSLFNPLMIRYTERITNPSFVADTVSMDDVLNVAVKYFNILGMTKEGYYKGKVCAGVNGITETLQQRKPQLEAFCFSAILENFEGKEFNMHNEFVAAIRQLYKQDLGVNREDRILRAQGAMFSLMRNNEPLKKMLISEYENKKDFLPFVLEHAATANKN